MRTRPRDQRGRLTTEIGPQTRVAKAMIAFRQKRGLVRKQLAYDARIARTALGYYEQGFVAPRATAFARWARALKLNDGELRLMILLLATADDDDEPEPAPLLEIMEGRVA